MTESDGVVVSSHSSSSAVFMYPRSECPETHARGGVGIDVVVVVVALILEFFNVCHGDRLDVLAS
jgi:hypothetical protein